MGLGLDGTGGWLWRGGTGGREAELNLERVVDEPLERGEGTDHDDSRACVEQGVDRRGGGKREERWKENTMDRWISTSRLLLWQSPLFLQEDLSSIRHHPSSSTLTETGPETTETDFSVDGSDGWLDAALALSIELVGWQRREKEGGIER